MKKQNINNKLRYNKSSIVELNDSQINDINGGTSPLPAISAVSAGGASVVGSLIGSAVISAAGSIVAITIAVSVYTIVREK